MPTVDTAEFGAIEYELCQAYEFPQGLVGFEQERRFVLFARPGLDPFLFLQSLEQKALRFVALAAEVVCPGYRYDLSEEDLSALCLPAGWADGSWCAPGDAAAGLACLVLAAFPDGGAPMVNLMAPVVMARATGRAVQSIQFGKGYSHCHPLPGHGHGEPAC